MSATNPSAASQSIPSKIIISLRVGLVLALANIICVSILAYAWKSAKATEKTISVTGSAKKQITSDLIVWTARVQVDDKDLAAAYAKLRKDVDATRTYLTTKGVPAPAITPSSISTLKHFTRDTNGRDTTTVDRYELSESLTVTSPDVEKVGELSRSVTELIEKGVLIDSQPPQYLYTKLADLKITMLAEATKDATTRADKIATNANSTLGPVTAARMGVLQINALHESEASSSGVNDTTSLEKEITAVVTATFSIK